MDASSSPTPSSRRPFAGLSALVGAALLLTLGGCATNPVTGRPMFALVTESQEIEMGRQYAPQIADSMGIYPDEALQRYVESVALPMASASERPQLPWQFQVIDDPAINAFAVPGGFLYVTRGILAHMNSEAELASVLGHEIGHVTARHSVSQMSKAQLAQIGLVASAIALGDSAGSLMPLASGGLQLLFLKYGRDDERQSDDLGLRYMTGAGYEPLEMVKMFQTLGRTRPSDDSGRVPEWLSTHPDPENREARIAAAIAELPPERARASLVKRDTFLRQIDGMVYGPDPRAGFFAGRRFHHPELAFRLEFPEGWRTANRPEAVLAISPEQDAIVQLSLVKATSAAEAARTFFAQEGLRAGAQETGRVNGLPSVAGAFAATTEQGEIEGRVRFIEHAGSVYQLLGYGAQQAFAKRLPAVQTTLASFAVERDSAVLGAEPWHLEVVQPSRALSIEEFARVYAGPVSAEELALLNQIGPGERYARGVAVKRVKGRPLPGTR